MPHMDDSLRIIQHLYGEEVDDPSFIGRFAEDEELREEYDELKQTKNALDRRSSPSPDDEVVDRIVRRAGDTASSGPDERRASDRDARAPTRSRSRHLRGLSAAVAVVMLLGFGWWYLPIDTGPAGSLVGESPAPETESVPAAAGEARRADALPEWDDRDAVVRLHRRIEQLQTRSRSDAWGGDLQPASQSRP